MPNKQITAITISILFSMATVTAALASQPVHIRDSTKTALVKKPLAIKRIDTLSLSQNEKELASSTIRELLNDQLSPLRKQMKENRNAFVNSYINKYTNPNYHSHLSKMKGLASYYFPIFEKVFNETNIPSDIKYLAIVESSLNPHAVSRVGATGPWQFMYATAKGYGLQINSYVDERKDPIEATYAAANYLKEAYSVYGDWFLAIASYNCGQGNVNRAIRRSGKDNPTFWDIRPYLPNETKNYVPAFIAICHVLGNPEKYPIEPNYTDLPEDIDVILIEKNLSLSSVAKVLEMNPDNLYQLNPSYKRKIVNGSKSNPSRLIVPKVHKNEYAKLYSFLQGNTNTSTALIAQNTKESIDSKVKYHRVRKGEKLSEIAVYYNIDVQDLLAWNNLNPSTPIVGQNLQVSADMQASRKVVQKENYYIAYKVKKGDTLDAITKRFKGSSVSSLKAMNGLKGNTINPGMTLKISQN